jgi:hypothetical protein
VRVDSHGGIRVGDELPEEGVGDAALEAAHRFTTVPLTFTPLTCIDLPRSRIVLPPTRTRF